MARSNAPLCRSPAWTAAAAPGRSAERAPSAAHWALRGRGGSGASVRGGESAAERGREQGAGGPQGGGGAAVSAPPVRRDEQFHQALDAAGIDDGVSLLGRLQEETSGEI